MQQFCGKAQFPYSFGWLTQNYAENCVFPQNVHTRKLGETKVSYPVKCTSGLRIKLEFSCSRHLLERTYQTYWHCLILLEFHIFFQIFCPWLELQLPPFSPTFSKHGNKNTEIPSIKIPLNIARQNHYLDSRCIITIMIPEMMSRAICCKKSF